MALSNESLKLIEYELSVMKPRQALFEIVKAEMKKRNHWKYLPRGKSFKTKGG